MGFVQVEVAGGCAQQLCILLCADCSLGVRFDGKDQGQNFEGSFPVQSCDLHGFESEAFRRMSSIS